ncbi:MAG: amidohydrolase family protein [Rhodospirillaceae bacterium]|jgi:predicted TIM-barrel fold metal-dependent hydrolase|nr:amidohydrolase family protein [Rhodospirillaceae bacterium]MBT5457000.1 amidohydrolase family protein [Rhodospirillaceae bacterium]
MAYIPPAVIDSDAHVIENNLTWDHLEPAEAKYRPNIVTDPKDPTVKRWEVNGQIGPRVLATVEAPDGIGTTAGKSDRNVGTPQESRELSNIKARLDHMDALGIDIQVLHTTMWLYPMTQDPDAEAAMTFAWNKWLAAIWDQSDGRLPWSCLVPLSQPDEAVRQMRWARERGAVAVFMRPLDEDRSLIDESFYPIYQEAENLDMSMAVHIANGSDAHVELYHNAAAGSRALPFTLFRTPTVTGTMLLLMSDIKKTFPKLRWGIIEASAQWVPWIYNEAARRIQLTGTDAPKNLFEQANIFITCQTDDDLPWVLKYCGENCLLVGTDYGHGDPSSDIDATVQIRDYEGISDHVKDNILFHNPKKLFALDLDGKAVRSAAE